MTDTDDPRSAIVLVTALLVSAIVGVILVDSLLTGRELRRAARKLRADAERITRPEGQSL